MLINQNVLNSLTNDAGISRKEKALTYVERNLVEITNSEYENMNNFWVTARVKGTKNYRTYISVKNGEVEDITCNCQDYYNHYGVCKHTLATIFLYKNNYLETKNNKMEEKEDKQDEVKFRNFKQIVNTFYNEEIEGLDVEEEQILKNKGTIKIEPKIFYDKLLQDMRVEFKIGNKKMYKIKKLSEFYTRMLENQFYKYGEKLQFIHNREMFEEESKKLLDFILKYAEIIKYANSNSNSNYRYYGKALSETSIILGNSGIDELFEVIKNKKVNFQKDYNQEKIEFTAEDPKIEFRLKKEEENTYTISPNIDIFNVNIIKGKNYKYILDDKKLYRCSKEFEKTTLKLLELFRQNYMTQVLLGKKELRQLFSIIMPKVENAIKIENLSKEEIEKYKPKELVVKVFLDFDEMDHLIADVKFCYEQNEFNPLDEKQKITFARNKIKETKVLNIFRKTGFMLDIKNLRLILPDDDKIYEFLSEDINYYMQKFEVMVTDKFKTKQIKEPKLGNIGVSVENDLLSIDLKNIDIDPKELKEILTKYDLKKKYHRLKDGSFINLQNNKEIDFLDKLVTGMEFEYKELEKGEIKLPVNRSLYLNQLLKGIKGTQIIKNEEYKNIVNNLNKEQLEEDIKVPSNLENILRYYQKTGFKWLKVLDGYNFGGILADDMGLRKDNTNVICNSRLFSKCKKTKRRKKSKFSSIAKFINFKLAK